MRPLLSALEGKAARSVTVDLERAALRYQITLVLHFLRAPAWFNPSIAPYLSGMISNTAKTLRWYFGLKLLSDAMISV